MSAVFAVCGAAFATWAARVPAVADQLNLTTGELAAGLFGLAAGSVVMLVAAGPLLTSVGSRGGALAGTCLLCGGLPAVAVAPNLPVLVVALVVFGAGNSLLDVSMNAHAARVEQGYRRPIFAGFHAFWNIGGMLGSALSALLAAGQVPVHLHFPAAGCGLLLVALAAIGGCFLAGPDPGQGGAAFELPGRALLALGAIAFCGFLVEGTVNDWSALLLVGNGAGPALASLGYFGFSLTMILVRLVADRVSARTGAAVFVRVASVLTALGLLLVAAVPIPLVGVVGCALIGLGVSGIVPLAWSSAGQRQPEAPGKALAAVATCGYLGFLVGPVLVGSVAGVVGLPVAFGALALAAVAVHLLARTMAPAGG